ISRARNSLETKPLRGSTRFRCSVHWEAYRMHGSVDGKMSTKLGIGVAIGVAIGAALGIALDNPALGIGFGIAIGIAISLALPSPRVNRDEGSGQGAPRGVDGDGGGVSH